MREGGEGGQGGRLGIALASAVPQCQGGRPLECPESLEAAAGRGWGNETKGKERRRSRARAHAQCRFELLGNVSPATGATRTTGREGDQRSRPHVAKERVRHRRANKCCDCNDFHVDEPCVLSITSSNALGARGTRFFNSYQALLAS